MLDCVVYKEKKQINLCYLTYFYLILYDFISCPGFLDIKQSLCYKLAIDYINIIRETIIFNALFPMFFPHFFAG